MTDTAILQARYDAFCALGLHLDMSRGKPEPRQLDLSLPMLRMTDAGFLCEDGVDARNYGDPTGIPEAKRLFGALLGMPPEQVIVGGKIDGKGVPEDEYKVTDSALVGAVVRAIEG